MSAAQRLSPASFIKHAAEVSSFYGFRPLREVEQGLARPRARAVHTFATSMDTCLAHIGQKASEPVLTYFATPAPSHVPSALPPKETAEFGLHVVGSPESLGEVIVLKTLVTIVSEWGTQVARVRINAMGDRDSKQRFERELMGYLRRSAHLLDQDCRKAVGENMLGVYRCQNEACREVLLGGPRAMSFLSEKSRTHFREVLEHLEGLGLPYEIDDLLVGDEREPRIVFSLDLAGEDATILASMGGRYDEYVRKVSAKKDGAAVCASIYFRRGGLSPQSFAAPGGNRAPKVYFVQLGERAKLQGLTVLDLLREAQVPVLQSFGAKSLSPQLEHARARGVSHLLIMGQREALDGTVIIRSTQNSSQQIVELATLPRLLKSLKV